MNSNNNSRIALIITKLDFSDGGCIYISKHVHKLDKNTLIVELIGKSFFYRKVLTALISHKARLFFRIPFAAIFYIVMMKFLAQKLVKVIKSSNDLDGVSCVVFPTGDMFALEVSFALKRKRVVPRIHFSILDLPWTYKDSFVNNYIYKRYIINNLKHVDTADCISSPMKTILESYAPGKTFVETYALVDLLHKDKECPKHEIQHTQKNQIIRICFAGNLRFRKEVLLMMNSVANLDLDIQFHFFSKHELVAPNIIQRGYISDIEEFRVALKEMDAGFVPMSFSEQDRLLVETSFPSKAISYLSAGLPLIVFAPEYSALSKFVIEYKLGLVISNPRDFPRVIDKLVFSEKSVNNIRELSRHSYERLIDLLFHESK
jgi:hypothetical protein